MVRFLHQFEQGNGNYTHDRKKWLADKSIQTAAQRIRGRKKNRL